MIAHVVGRRKSFARVLRYLAGPGRNGEHVSPRVIAGDREAGAFVEQALEGEAPRLAAEHLDSARRAWGSQVKEPALHVVLSFKAGEHVTDERRRQVYEAYVERMGCFDRSAWVAVEHGKSAQGHEHGHLVISCVGDDGKAVRLGKHKERSREVARGLERDFGLRVLPSHEAGLQGMRGIPRVEYAAAEDAGQPVTMTEELHRRVRAAKAEARDAHEFMARARAHGVEFKPRYAKGSTTDMTGYSVRLPVDGARWYKGGNLARDLSLPRLKEQWQARAAGGELAGRQAAHEAAGAFASMSRAHERDPGPMWRISRELARSAQAPRGAHAASSALRVGAMLASPEKGPAEWLVIGATVVNAAAELHAAHVAAGHHGFAGELERVRTDWQAVRPDLAAVAAVEPAREPWLGRDRSTERGIEIE